MVPPSTRDIIEMAGSKYGVVVAASQKTRTITEQGKEEYRLSRIVSELLDELLAGDLSIKYPQKP